MRGREPSGLWLNVYWSPTKAARNVRKHGIGFEEGRSVLADLLAATAVDDVNPNREVWIGLSERNRLLVVAIEAAWDENVVCILSVRKAEPHEREIYEES